MRNILKRSSRLLAALSLLLAMSGNMVLAPVMVRAEDGSDSSSSTSTENENETEKETETESEEKTQAELEAKARKKTEKARLKAEAEAAKEAREKARELDKKQAEISAKLTEKRLEACEKKEDKINAIFKRVSARGARQIAVFNKIAERTMAFYDEKGNTLATYEELKTAVEEKKAAAEAAVELVSESSVEFACDGTDPRGTAESFQDVSKEMIAALKDYKTAVKNLIVGVKSVNSVDTDDSQENN